MDVGVYAGQSLFLGARWCPLSTPLCRHAVPWMCHAFVRRNGSIDPDLMELAPSTPATSATRSALYSQVNEPAKVAAPGVV